MKCLITDMNNINNTVTIMIPLKFQLSCCFMAFTRPFPGFKTEHCKIFKSGKYFTQGDPWFFACLRLNKDLINI